MGALLWYRFRMLWKQFKWLFIVMIAVAVVVLAVALICGRSILEEEHFYFGFSIGFLSVYTAMLPIFVLQTEEKEKNIDLLLTMPWSRKQIAIGNYAMTWICAAVMGIYSLLLTTALQENWAMIAFSAGIILLANTFYIPLFLFLGGQRALVVLMLLGAACGIGGKEWLPHLPESVKSLPSAAIFGGIAVVLIVLHGISICLSIWKYQKKDF